MIRWQSMICATLCLILAPGCAKQKTSDVNVNGTVTVEKTPLTEGLITFVPCNGTNGKKCSVVISEGRYIFDSSQDLAAGEYRVEIMGLPPGIKAMAEGKPPSLAKTSYREIAPAYNEKSTLHCTLQSGQENRYDFSVQYAR